MNYFNKIWQQLKFKLYDYRGITSPNFRVVRHYHSLAFLRDILKNQTARSLRFDDYISFETIPRLNNLKVKDLVIFQSDFWCTLNLIGIETENEKQIILYLQKHYGNHIDKLNAFITLEKYLNYPKRINFNKYLLLS